MSETLWNRSLIVTAAAVAVISAVSLWLAWTVSGDLSSHMSLLAVATILAAATTSYVFRILRFHFFLARSGVGISLRETALVQMVGFALSVTPGHVGEVFKLHLIRERAGTPVAQTAPILLLDRLTEGGGFLILAIVSGLQLPARLKETPLPALLLAGLALVFFFALTRNRWYKYAVSVRSPLQRYRWGRGFIPHVENLWRGLDASFTPRQLLGGLALSAAARFADGFVVLFAAQMLGVELALPTAVFVLAVSGLAGGISFLPAGTGAVETTMVGLLVALGATLPTALAISLMTRLATLWLWVGLGLALSFLLRWPSLYAHSQEENEP